MSNKKPKAYIVTIPQRGYNHAEKLQKLKVYLEGKAPTVRLLQWEPVIIVYADPRSAIDAVERVIRMNYEGSVVKLTKAEYAQYKVAELLADAS